MKWIYSSDEDEEKEIDEIIAYRSLSIQAKLTMQDIRGIDNQKYIWRRYIRGTTQDSWTHAEWQYKLLQASKASQ